jgi:hypothetical protein
MADQHTPVVEFPERNRPAHVDPVRRDIMKTIKSFRLIQVCALFTLLLPAGAALAQSTKIHSNEDWVPVKHLEFTPDDVEGGLLGPEGEQIISVKRVQHSSLIEIRAGFEPEIVKMLEDL